MTKSLDSRIGLMENKLIPSHQEIANLLNKMVDEAREKRNKLEVHKQYDLDVPEVKEFSKLNILSYCVGKRSILGEFYSDKARAEQMAAFALFYHKEAGKPPEVVNYWVRYYMESPKLLEEALRDYSHLIPKDIIKLNVK